MSIAEKMKQLIDENRQLKAELERLHAGFTEQGKIRKTTYIKPKICENCGKEFYPNRSTAKYCNSASPQDKNKSCSDYMKYQKFLLKNQTDIITKLYKQIYNSKLNRIKRSGKTPSEDIALNSFKEKADAYRKAIKADKSIEVEFIEWLKSEKLKGWMARL